MKTHRFISILAIFLTFGRAAWAGPGEGGGLLLDFHNVPLRAVLEYLSDKAGLIVVSEGEVRGEVSVTASQPVSIAEAVGLLNDQLSRNNYTAMLDGRTLTVMEASSARTNAQTPVLTISSPASIPVNNEIVTAIVPMHTLNPAQLLKDLAPLIPDGDTVTANEAGNAVIMTARQKDIHRLASIITALDSTAVSEVSVFPLDYADAKSVAEELKQLFQSGDADANRVGPRVSFGPRPGRIGVDGGAEQKEKTAPTKPVFVADEQMNAVAASAPPDYMPMIERVVRMLDKPGEDVTEMEIFPLQHADPGEVVDEISSLFASAGTGSAEQPSRPMGFQFGGPAGTASASRTGAATESSRLKRQSTVTAVADRRTQSVMVAAAGNAMAQVRKIVARLDQGNLGVMRVSVVDIGSADAGTVQLAMTSVFASPDSAAHSQASINTALAARIQALISSMSSPTVTSSVSVGSSGAAVPH